MNGLGIVKMSLLLIIATKEAQKKVECFLITNHITERRPINRTESCKEVRNS